MKIRYTASKSFCMLTVVLVIASCNAPSPIALQTEPSTNKSAGDSTATTPEIKPPIDEPAAQKLLLAARKETFHPGIILRYACQIPVSSPSFAASQREMLRAEKLWDFHIAKELRREAARDLQNLYYSDGRKIDVTVKEAPFPQVVLQGAMLDSTTAYVFTANGTDNELGKKFLPLGVRSISYHGPEESSSNNWKADDVHHEEFGKMEALCEDVRQGNKSPDAINATVSNPK